MIECKAALHKDVLMKNGLSGGKQMNIPYRKARKSISESRIKKLMQKKLQKEK